MLNMATKRNIGGRLLLHRTLQGMGYGIVIYMARGTIKCRKLFLVGMLFGSVGVQIHVTLI